MPRNRLFIACTLTSASKKTLNAALKETRQMYPDLRWLPRDNWHLTLRFLGESDREQRAALEDRLPELVPETIPVRAACQSLSAFPDIKRPSVVAVELSMPSGWQALAQRLEIFAQNLGYTASGHAFRPHISVARVRRGKRPKINLTELKPGLEVQFSELVLFESHLSASGARYEPEICIPLAEVPEE